MEVPVVARAMREDLSEKKDLRRDLGEVKKAFWVKNIPESRVCSGPKVEAWLVHWGIARG